jgi:Uma2 family endonuclease
MGMPAPHTDWTAEMARALPDDGKRYEVLDGVLFVSPSPSRAHQRAVRLLLVMFDEYCRRYGLGEALASPADIEFSPKDLVQPDVFVVPRIARSWRDVATLSLAVEVLSPSTARTDRHEKRRRYQREGVPEYWIVDLDGRIVERWRPDDMRPEVLVDALIWKPDPDTAALEIDLPRFFSAALAD